MYIQLYAYTHTSKHPIHTLYTPPQVPRIYRVFKKIGKVNCFQDTLDNFFGPLFDATLHPDASDDNRNIAAFLANITGFDSVDDESRSKRSKSIERAPLYKCILLVQTSYFISHTSTSYYIILYNLYYVFIVHTTIKYKHSHSQYTTSKYSHNVCGHGGATHIHTEK